MRLNEIQDLLIEIVNAEEGRFISAYQICQRIAELENDIWQRLIEEYPSNDPNIVMGEGTGRHYSPASYVANAMSKLANSENARVRQEIFSCKDVAFGEVIPGFTGNTLGIWARA